MREGSIWPALGTTLAQFGNRGSQTQPRQCFLCARKEIFLINNGIISGYKDLALTREHIGIDSFLAWLTQLAW